MTDDQNTPPPDPLWDRNVRRARDVIGIIAGVAVLAYSTVTEQVWGQLVGAALLTGTFILARVSRLLDR